MDTTPPDRTPRGWSDVADAYDDVITPRFTPYAEDALRETGLRAGMRALDVASGPGALALAAARRGASVVAVDFAPGMVERLAKRARAEKLAVDARVMDAHALDLEDGAFDAAYCAFGVMFFDDRVKALREMRRVVRPGGKVAILTWGAPERVGFFRLFEDAMGRAVPGLPVPDAPPTPFSMGEPRIVEDAMRAAGLAKVAAMRVVHEMDLGGPERAWADMTTTNPVVPALLAQVGPAGVPAVRKALEDEYRRAARGGSVRLPAEAILGVGEA